MIILSGDYKKGEKGYEFPTIVEESKEKVFGGKMRLLAGLELLRNGKTPLLILTGGKGLGENELSNAKAQAKLLRERYNVRDEELMIAEENELGTRAQAAHLKEFLEENSLLDKKVLVITSAYHLPRTVRFFREAEVNVKFLPAEKILWQKSSHYQSLIRKLYKSKEMDIRRAFEQAGIKALIEGSYKSPQKQ